MQPLYKPPCPPQEWSYLRGGLSTLDRDYGIINNIHHDIGTHVVRKIGKKKPASVANGPALVQKLLLVQSPVTVQSPGRVSPIFWTLLRNWKLGICNAIRCPATSNPGPFYVQVHHLLPQIPHYNLCEATEAVKPVMGPYYR